MNNVDPSSLSDHMKDTNSPSCSGIKDQSAKEASALNYENGARWLHGPALVEWLAPYVPPETSGETGWLATLHRRMHVWRDGALVDLFTLDRYLINLGLHPTEIPDHAWLAKHPGSRQWSKQVKRAAMQAYADGMSMTEIRRRHGPSRDTIMKWGGRRKVRSRA